MARVRKLQDKRGWAFGTVVAVWMPALGLMTRREVIDGELIPATGGCVVVVNHVSHVDPMSFGLFLHDHGRLVRYLAKDALFHMPVIKHLAKGAKQIPVSRATQGAASAFDAAVEAVREGECIGVYPEGTITKDPEGWPMRGKTGAARIALATGCPVVPVGQWGVQELLPAYSLRLRPFPPKTIRFKVGHPVDLADLIGKPVTNAVLHEATDRIMAAITALVEDLRGERAPTERFDPKTVGVSEIGNPKKGKKR
ncbi:MAG: lysophospholipid acyltransferase family protein [Marmoricola sp.]